MKLKQSNMSIGQNIKRLRLLSGYTQSQIAALVQLVGVDISYDVYKKIEQNKYNVPIELLVALKSILGIDYDDFFTGLSLDSTAAPKK